MRARNGAELNQGWDQLLAHLQSEVLQRGRVYKAITEKQVINQPVENKERGAVNANKQRINDEIRAREVRLIGADGS